jgi:exportin-7
MNNASNALNAYLTKPEHIPQMFYILTRSSHAQLVYVTLSALHKMLPVNWKAVSNEEKVSLNNCLMNMLFQPSVEYPAFVKGAACQLAARVIRLAWLEVEQLRGTIGQVEQFIQVDKRHIILGMRLFDELIKEVLDPIKSRPLSIHRKIAISFRDEGLKQIVEFVHYLLTKYSELPTDLISPLISVFNNCLCFDFLGVMPDDTSEDPVSLQIPITWKGMFENPYILDVMLVIACSSTGEYQQTALRTLNHLGAVRKSIFGGNQELKKNYTTKYLNLLIELMNQSSLSNDGVFELMQMSKRFLQNFQIKELSENESLSNWLTALANFSYKQFGKEDAIVSAYQSNMFLWSYLAYEGCHQLTETGNLIAQYIPRLFKAFLEFTLGSISSDIVEEYFRSDDNGSEFREHIEMIANMSMYFYSPNMRELQSLFNTIMTEYRNCLLQGMGNRVHLESQLILMIYIASALIGLREKKTKEAEEHLDSNMIHYIFQMMNFTDSIYKEKNEVNQYLECAILFFLSNLVKSYVNSPNDSLWVFFETGTSDSATSQSLGEETLLNVLRIIVEKV